MRPSRSLSFTRSSPTSRKTVVPLRPRGEHGEQGDLVDEAGDLAGADLRAREAPPAATTRSATGSPKLVSPASSRDRRAHPLEHLKKAGAGRIDAHARDRRARRPPPAPRRRPGTRPRTGRRAPGGRTARAGRRAGTRSSRPARPPRSRRRGACARCGRASVRAAPGASTATSPTTPARSSELLICALDTGIS